jgi:hypothetical protein
MENSLLFRVRPDGENARWTNLARLIGLFGILLVAISQLVEGSSELLSDIIGYPGALLALANLVWIYLIPSIFMLALYSISYAIIAIVNFIHILILQRNNEELVYFMTKFLTCVRGYLCPFWG